MSEFHSANQENRRSCIMRIAMVVGRLCQLGIDHFPSLPNGRQAPPLSAESNFLVVKGMTELLVILQITANAFDIPLLLAIEKKLTLNDKKYPLQLCGSYIEKWTAYSHISGVTKENQWIDIVKMDLSPNKVVIDGKISELVENVVRFTDARKWGKYDTPRNLILGIISEVGELADLIQWEGDGVVEKSTGDRSGDDISSLETPQHHQINKVAQEIADICIYVLKLANALNIVEELEGALAKHKL